MPVVVPPSTQGAAFHPSLLRPGEGGRPPVPRGTGEGPSLPGLRSRAVVAPSSLQNDPAAIVAGARHVPVGRTVLVESVCAPRRRALDNPGEKEHGATLRNGKLVSASHTHWHDTGFDGRCAPVFKLVSRTARRAVDRS